MPGTDDDTLTVYSDYVCPFCYLGHRSLEQYRGMRTEPLAVDWHPFDLRRGLRGPDGTIDRSIDDGKDEAYYDRVRENVERLRADYGVEMLDFDDVPEVDSLRAQVASFAVRDAHRAAWPAFDEAVFEALWVDGRDIGDPTVLTAIAEDVGLAGETIGEAVDDGSIRERVEARFERAQRRGITGVPTFTYRGTAARGAVPPAQLARLVEGQ